MSGTERKEGQGDHGPVDWRLLDRYLAGECSPAELEVVADWLAADPTRSEALNALRGGSPPETFAVATWSQDQFWRGLARRVGRQHVAASKVAVPMILPGHARQDRGRLGRMWRQAPGWAVAAAVGIVVGVVLWRGASTSGSTTLIHEYATAAGQHQTVRLPDGTRLTLAPSSHLRLAANYGRRSRQVFLDGEAFFSVVHDAAHPFAVQAGDVTIRDVGTQFDARAYADEQGARVAVVEGTVSVNNALAQAGDVVVADGNRILLQHDAHVSMYLAWLQGGLVFEKTPLREVVRDISRTFGVTITVADSTLLSQRITATLSNEPLDVVLDAVVRVVGARFERTPHGVVIRSVKTHHVEEAPHLRLTTARLQDRQE